ncbi:hypothetical protein BI065_gp21 [Weissella phage WCP30]|uniref:hypothetical protein n=1 Tax=Weissella phage WCP30 TaxID=1837862 RepID=UPI0008111E83|nr:hypothetical protein BI065_gp21 [Weissella phage WCP30]ANU78886.1 hypothetical protein [Weissella phage WCP30]
MVYSEHNVYEASLINENGERLGLNQINDLSIQALDDNQLEEASYYVKLFEGKFKIIKKELDRRLKNEGVQFAGVSVKDVERTNVKDDETIKRALVKKYGWDAVSVKTPATLLKLYGEEVMNDLIRADAIETKTVKVTQWR